MDVDQEQEKPTDDEIAWQAEIELRKGLAWSGGGFLLAAGGLLSHREWGEWVAGIGTVITLVGGVRLLRAAKHAGELQNATKATSPAPQRPSRRRDP